MGGAHVSFPEDSKRLQADQAECTRHCLRNDIGSWTVYIWSRHGRTLSIDENLGQT
jgi:hypothetical protein